MDFNYKRTMFIIYDMIACEQKLQKENKTKKIKQ